LGRAWLLGLATEPAEVDEATSAYRQDSDPLKEFYDARCVFDSDAKVSRKALRAEYEAWCRDNGAEPLGARRVADSLRERGVVDGGNVRSVDEPHPLDAWRGVRLRTYAERDRLVGM
jgi:phage/plasmid-associated DNA primase